MAIESTRDLCLSVADAIREKKGSSELINPQDFAKEIASIEGGGNGGGEGEDRYICFDYRNHALNHDDLWEWSSVIKVKMEGMPTPLIMPTNENLSMIKENNAENYIVAILMDPNLKFMNSYDTMQLTTLGEFQQLYSLDMPRLTESQFYDLNA